MTRFELEYLISLRSDSVVEMLSVMAGLQIAIVVAIYYLKGIRDLAIRHALLGLYTLTMLLAAGKSFMDMSVIGVYTAEILALFPETHESKIGVMRLPEYTREFFIAGFGVLYILMWSGTVYFLYFHQFIAPAAEESPKPRPFPTED